MSLTGFDMGVITDYHKTRSVLDMAFIEAVFIGQEREFLEAAQANHPNSVIRSPHVDLGLKGYGGSVPAEWDGTVYDWNGKQIN
jgi:hypothetical protein